MIGEHHDLLHELPEYRDKIHEMKTGNNHFAKLFDQYHEVDHEVRRIEQGIETPSDDYTEEMKKKRLALKDELFQMLKAA
ncbi:MAG: YdcH family protein [Pseudomonadota bacterium]